VAVARHVRTDEVRVRLAPLAARPSVSPANCSEIVPMISSVTNGTPSNNNFDLVVPFEVYKAKQTIRVKHETAEEAPMLVV